ncbi:MAG: alanine--tRNA ligase [Candidatus Thermoplasmatota archaeon]|nr:alanine--tRNA ligase [Candidatus Thermoplasmatota archaeon]
MFEEEYRLEFFKHNRYARRICKKCKTPFWSIEELATCSDTPCSEYGFIGNSPVKKCYEVSEMRNEFLKFFEALNHKIIKRYPVIARWREDVFLVNASIYNFQPLVTSGLVKPPANPLVISQPCIRLNDIDLVGKTSKHLTTFEMLGHHAFNTKKEKIYWKEETIGYCNEFLTTKLGVAIQDIIYKEKPWFGGGNAGAALEVVIKGLEVATLVFMQFQQDSKGSIELGNERYSPMATKVVDPGYGLERMVWLSKATPTIYEAIYPDCLEYLIGLSETDIADYLSNEYFKGLLVEYSKLSSYIELGTKREIENVKKSLLQKLSLDEKYFTALEILTSIYALADSIKCIAFMLGDCIVPSNVRAGYLARLVIRKALRTIEELKIKGSLAEIVAWELERLVDFPELKDNMAIIMKILELETGKYRTTLEKGKSIVKRALAEGKKLEPLVLVEFYDTYGIHPTVVQKVAEESNISIEVPESFYSILAERHLKVEQKGAPKEALPFVTEVLFYEEPEIKEFDAKVIYVKDNHVILDRTAFYPEAGGQSCDKGVIVSEKGNELKVIHVEKSGNAIIHTVVGSLAVGEKVHCKINWRRRVSLTRHHTATHIILGTARKILGPHVWQEGAQKTLDFARLDISHFARITSEELKKIELEANRIVAENIKIDKKFVSRNEAEQKYGFRLYQGGVPPGNKIRVVKINEFDVQACAGTHCKTTNEVGLIKITRHERIQDGIERLEFVAGEATLKEIQKADSILREASLKLRTTPSELLRTIDNFIEDWKLLRKEVETLREYKAKSEVKKLALKPESVGNIKIISDILPLDRDELFVLAGELIKHDNIVTILGSDKEEANFVIARSMNLDFIDCAELAKECAKLLNGSGGGKKDFAQGGGAKKEALKQALEMAKKSTKRLVR